MASAVILRRMSDPLPYRSRKNPEGQVNGGRALPQRGDKILTRRADRKKTQPQLNKKKTTPRWRNRKDRSPEKRRRLRLELATRRETKPSYATAVKSARPIQRVSSVQTAARGKRRTLSRPRSQANIWRAPLIGKRKSGVSRMSAGDWVSRPIEKKPD